MANQPSLIPSAWAASNTAVNPIPATTSQTGKASWAQGFPIETSKPLTQGGVPPQYGDFNGILKVLSEFALYAQSGGQYAWVNSLDYNAGAVVVGSDGYLYRAAQASGPSTTAVNPVGDVSGTWEKVVSQSDLNAITSSLGNVTSTANDAYANASAANAAVNTLDANVVKLSGAQTVGGAKTYTGSAVFSSGATFSAGTIVSSGLTVAGGEIVNSVDTGQTSLRGGTTNSGGASLIAYGKDEANNAGAFRLRAYDSAATDLIGKPDGTLTWNGKDVITNGGDQTVGGVKTFTSDIFADKNNFVIKNVTSGNVGEVGVLSGNGYVNGAYLVLYGASNASRPGEFRLCTPNGSKALVGNTDGTLTWNGVMEFTKSNEGVTVSKSASRQCKLLVGESYVGLYDVVNLQWIVRVADNKAYIHYGTLQAVSDKRQKQDISDVKEALLDAWGDVQWQQFRYKKVSDDLQHIGLVAQDVEDVLKTHDLIATDYGFISHEQNEEDGGESYYISYTDALSIEAAYQRRRADRAEARITALEQRLNEMEAVLASLISPISEEQTAESEEGEGAE